MKTYDSRNTTCLFVCKQDTARTDERIAPKIETWVLIVAQTLKFSVKIEHKCQKIRKTGIIPGIF